MFFKKKNTIAVESIYQNIIKISRSKFFYLDLKLEDTFETRFDLIIFHAFLVFFFYKKKSISKPNLSQELFDHMFSDFDNNLREMGFGDIAVNKKMKIFVTAFYGRIAQYSKGMDEYYSNNDINILKKTILNNVYKGAKINERILENFVQYMINCSNVFLDKEEVDNLKTNFQFPNFYN